MNAGISGMDPMPSAGDFGQIRAFVAVAEARSFTRAAERLGLSPQALSQTVRALEGRLGVRLLSRTTRSVAPTEAGEDMLRQVGPAIAELGEAHILHDGEEHRRRRRLTYRMQRALGDLFTGPYR